MKNKISDLRDHLFAALERLGNEDLSKEDLQREIERSRAISEVGKVIVESAKTQVLFAKMTHKKEEEPKKFLEEPEDTKEPLARPVAGYTNKGHLSLTGS